MPVFCSWNTDMILPTRLLYCPRVANMNPLGNHVHAILFCFPGIVVVLNAMYHIYIHGYVSYHTKFVYNVTTTIGENVLYILIVFFHAHICGCYWHDIGDSPKHYEETVDQITLCIEVIDLPINIAVNFARCPKWLQQDNMCILGLYQFVMYLHDILNTVDNQT